MAVFLIYGGLAVYLVGVIWLVYLAWSNDQPLMAVGIFFLAPIVGTIYLFQNFDDAKIPYAIMILGFILRIAGAFAL